MQIPLDLTRVVVEHELSPLAFILAIILLLLVLGASFPFLLALGR